MAPAVYDGVTADRAAPQPRGATITFTASAVRGITPHQIKWWIFRWRELDGGERLDFVGDGLLDAGGVNSNCRVGVWVRSADAGGVDARESVASIRFPSWLGA